MTTSRREVIQAALAAALAAATPASLFALAERSLAPGERFLFVSLRGGRFLAIDRFQGRKAYLLSKGTARDGEYALSKSGSVLIGGGALRGVKGSAQCTGYSLVQGAGAIEVKDSRGMLVSRIAGPAGRRR